MKTHVLFASVSLALLGSAASAWAEPESCQKVRLSDLGWTDLALTNATASLLLNSLGYETEQTLLGLNVTYEMLKTNQVDVFLGNWLPVQEEQFKSYFDDGDVEVIVTNLTGAKFTLAVPSYVAEAGVKSYDDLAGHADKFDATIYGIEAGSNQPLLDMITADRHGLKDWQVIESSETAMLTQVDKMTKSNEWIVFLAWEPHPMNINYKLTYLNGGDAEYGPNYGGATVRTIARKGYAKECPNVAKLLKNLTFHLDYENIGMNAIMTDGADPAETAKRLIAKRPEILEKWLAGVTARDGGDGLQAAQDALLAR
ncbi:choline ABC transporter substrate-binding protein [Shinella sp. CPCC 101442]|uniref:choline ABC transporter substrate-binding protein n=1 Tax=Shinella sp. CPCC 101442 TaxID=2932265 RepID=UPI0021520973|nr:choline ABC transporter substrate-binding protein [Shinella sp. CPCC 101442]MCR6497581.1 choline ABC transporter substrate-binding protein [Shinella sp. CPCC 101442]